MSQPPFRGSTSSRPRGRGGRNRGKSARARGSTRGMRIPPEYLAQAIAQREGRDPSDIIDPTEDDIDEEDVKAYYAKFASRPLESNADKYEEPLDESADVVEEDDTNDILARHRMQELEKNEDLTSTSKDSEQIVDENDVDHALGASLRQISIQSGKRPAKDSDKNESNVVTIEWNQELEDMKREKAEAEARTALKQRFKNPSTRGRFQPRTAVAVPTSKAHTANPDLEQMEGFLDDLLN